MVLVQPDLHRVRRRDEHRIASELLIQSLEEQDAKEIKSAWLTAIQRRDHEIRAGVAVLKPADQVLREARAQLRGLQ